MRIFDLENVVGKKSIIFRSPTRISNEFISTLPPPLKILGNVMVNDYWPEGTSGVWGYTMRRERRWDWCGMR